LNGILVRLTHVEQRPAERARAPEGQWLHDRAPRAGAGSGEKEKPSTSDDKWAHDRAPGARSGGGDGDGGISQKLIVSKLHYEVTEKDLSVRPLPTFPFYTHIYFLAFRVRLAGMVRSCAILSFGYAQILEYLCLRNCARKAAWCKATLVYTGKSCRSTTAGQSSACSPRSEQQY
jgi:hypothetical protein